LTAETWSVVALVGAAFGFVVLERRFPYNPGQGVFRTGFWTDFVLYCFVQSYVLGIVIGRLLEYLDGRTGWSHVGLISGWAVWQQVLFFLVTHDLYIYLFHRLQHRSKLLWRLHEAHHSVPQVDWLSGIRSHSLEILINQTIEFAPIVLLGAAPEVAVIKGTVSAIWGMFIHSNLNVRMGPLQYVINGPEMHRWHHADQAEAYGSNFATKFAFWDWLFGTAYFPPPDQKKAERYGLGYGGFPESFPAGYFLQQVRIFKRRLRDDHGATES
jgi:sterol desaturase/sphingolipid hydroxylase (fatty acid hydroxylase superfamily)